VNEWHAYPAATTAQLQIAHDKETNPETKAKIRAEIDKRKAGISRPRITPQIKGGLPIPRIGRM
jgi:hypothetical protein